MRGITVNSRARESTSKGDKCGQTLAIALIGALSVVFAVRTRRNRHPRRVKPRGKRRPEPQRRKASTFI
jgi:hypothetical protein